MRLFVTFLLTFFFSLTVFSNQTVSTTIESFYGPIQVNEPVIVDLINSPSFQRLKNIHQYGVAQYVQPDIEHYTRYDHSLGVYLLLKNHGASLDEQIAGLLHDVSHTVFSHVGDYIFGSNQKDAYQDDIHSWFLLKTELASILEKYGYSWEIALPHYKHYPMLEQELPNLCADRIEYNIQGGVLHQLITYEEAQSILKDLHYENEYWYFTDPKIANKFANLSLEMTEHLWGSSWNLITYQWAADAIKQGLQTNIISLEDIHFSTDQKVWTALTTTTDPIINNLIKKILSY